MERAADDVMPRRIEQDRHRLSRFDRTAGIADAEFSVAVSRHRKFRSFRKTRGRPRDLLHDVERVRDALGKVVQRDLGPGREAEHLRVALLRETPDEHFPVRRANRSQTFARQLFADRILGHRRVPREVGVEGRKHLCVTHRAAHRPGAAAEAATARANGESAESDDDRDYLSGHEASEKVLFLRWTLGPPRKESLKGSF